MNKPTVEIDSVGTKYWRLNGLYHNENGPAVEKVNGEKSWWIKGKLHRLDGPAIIWADGTRLWYINGCQLSELEFFMKTGNGN